MAEPLTLEQFKTLRAKGLSTEQIASFESGNIPSSSRGVSGSFDSPQVEQTNNLINQRPSGVDTLRKEVMQPWQPLEHPIKTALRPLVTGLKVAALPFESAESAIANPIRELINNPQANAKQVLSSMLRGITQKQPGQFGDIARDQGVPEPLAATFGLLTSAGVGQIASAGKLLKSANQAKTFIGETSAKLAKATGSAIRNKFPKLILDDKFVFNQAEKASQGMDDLYKGLSREYDNIYANVGNKLVNPSDVQATIANLPDNVINKFNSPQYRKMFTRNPDDSVIPSLDNLKAMKKVLRESVPEKVWNGRAIGDINTSTVEQVYGKINDIMAQAEPQLSAINKRYAEFMNMRKTIGRYIWDGQGNVVANPLKKLFTESGDVGHKQFFDNFAAQWTPANDIIKGIKQYNSRKAAVKFLGTKVAPVAGYVAVGGAAGAAAGSLLNK